MKNIFDTEKDINKDDWKAIKDEIEKGFDSTEDFLEYAFAVKILDPKFKIKIDIANVLEDIKVKIEETPLPELDSYGRENCPPLPPRDELEGLYAAIATIKIIDPTLQLNTKELWRGAIESLKELWTLNSNQDLRKAKDLISLAFYMKITDPSFNVDETFGDVGWENIINTLSDNRGGRDFEFEAKLKVLNPKIDRMISEYDWKPMRDNLLKARAEKDYYLGGFTEQAAVMKILAADKIIINENGLEII